MTPWPIWCQNNANVGSKSENNFTNYFKLVISLTMTLEICALLENAKQMPNNLE